MIFTSLLLYSLKHKLMESSEGYLAMGFAAAFEVAGELVIFALWLLK